MAADATHTAAQAVSAALVSMALSDLGITAPDLAWAAIGTGLGMVMTPPAGRMRSMALFGGTCFAAALLATIVADLMLSGHRTGRMGCAFVIGLTWPAIQVRLSALAPVLLDAVLRRLGIHPPEGRP